MTQSCAPPRTALPLPTASDVVLLQAATTYPSVSVLCTTEPGAGMPVRTWHGSTPW